MLHHVLVVLSEDLTTKVNLRSGFILPTMLTGKLNIFQ